MHLSAERSKDLVERVLAFFPRAMANASLSKMTDLVGDVAGIS